MRWRREGRVWREQTLVNCCLWYLSPRCDESSYLLKGLNVSSIHFHPSKQWYSRLYVFDDSVDANRTELLSAGWEAETSASQGVSGKYSLFQVGHRFSSRETLVFTARAFT